MEEYDEAVEAIKERRKKRALKVFVTEGLMVLAVILLVVFTTLVAIGYNVKPGEDWTIERTGLVQIQTKPTGANITVDGETIFGWTNMSRSMTEGEHEIILSRDGYDTWKKKISVMAGLYHRLDYPRLFLTEKKIETFEEIPEGYVFSFAKDGNIALLYSNEKTTWEIYEINNDKPKAKEFSVKDLFTPVLEGEVDSGVKIEAWSGNSEKVLVSRNNEWILLDVKRPEKSVNLSKKYGMKFSTVEIANDSANVLYAISDGGLRKIDVNDEKISSVLVQNVKMFDNLKLDLAYIGDDDGDGEMEFGLLRDEEKIEAKIKWNKPDSLEIDSEKIKNKEFLAPKHIKMMRISEYYGEYYLNLVSDENEWAVFRTEKMFDEDNRFDFVFYEKYDEEPRDLAVRGDGEIFVLDFSDNKQIFDVEIENVVKITTFLNAKWLDEHVIYDISSEGVLTVADFDRGNQRKMTENALPGAEVKISKNDKWMYFVSKENKLSRIVISN
ncbi:PEGA domain-containing protein [Candidatus Saccharibacteria bacterium]|nr:PEGA domain-containing protein [Candidatus Saccharibacteria bacterium]